MSISEGTLKALIAHRSSYQKPGPRPNGHPYAFWMHQAAIELKVQEPSIPNYRYSAWNQVVDYLVKNHEWAK